MLAPIADVWRENRSEKSVHYIVREATSGGQVAGYIANDTKAEARHAEASMCGPASLYRRSLKLFPSCRSGLDLRIWFQCSFSSSPQIVAIMRFVAEPVFGLLHSTKKALGDRTIASAQ